VHPGKYEATLRVTDDDGLVDTHALDINVSAALSATLSKDSFDPQVGETVTISSILTTQAAVTIKLKDRVGSVVRTLVDNVVRSGGFFSDTWDGKDDSGQYVKDGAYLYTIEYSANGQNYVYDLTNDVNPARYAPPVNYPDTFNPLNSDTNSFRYTLENKSEVTVYISYFGGSYGLAGPRVKTLLLREPQKKGSYVLVWDGTDDSGNLVEPHGYVIAVFGWRLPENSVIVSTKPIISDILVAPTRVNPDSGAYSASSQATLTYTLSKNADVTVSIYNSENYLVRTITVDDVPAGGGNTIVWDGKNEDNILVAPGTYRFKLIAEDDQGTLSSEGNALVVIFY
jgi:flagellar hook assembly protein FlgD